MVLRSLGGDNLLFVHREANTVAHVLASLKTISLAPQL